MIKNTYAQAHCKSVRPEGNEKKTYAQAHCKSVRPEGNEKKIHTHRRIAMS